MTHRFEFKRVLLVLGILVFLVQPATNPPPANAKPESVAQTESPGDGGEGKPENWDSVVSPPSPSFGDRAPLIWQVLIDSTFSFVRWWF